MTLRIYILQEYDAESTEGEQTAFTYGKIYASLTDELVLIFIHLNIYL